VDNYFTSGRKIAFVVHFMDIRHAPSKEDLLMKEWMDANNVRYFIVLSKADKLTRLEIQKRTCDFRIEASIQAEIPIIAISAENKTGMDEVKATIQKWVESL
jgi:GTP-binding protein